MINGWQCWFAVPSKHSLSKCFIFERWCNAVSERPCTTVTALFERLCNALSSGNGSVRSLINTYVYASELVAVGKI